MFSNLTIPDEKSINKTLNMRYFDKKIRRTIFIDTETEGGNENGEIQ